MKAVLGLMLAAMAVARAAEPPVYWLLWFDTEDYIEPTADDAAKRLAEELTRRGIRATFKVVGEKARVLEQRGRTDVLRALAAHDIGYHSDFHSVHPAPAEYLNGLGLLDGAAEFVRREEQGFRDVRRIFGVTPSCYGQPGNSWAPQANVALRRWGVPVYMDDGGHIGLDQQPAWYGGLLYIYNLGPHTMRADLNDPAKLADAKRKFDAAVASVRQRGGGVVQTYYHPTEFATTEFWDGVNFGHGANPERAQWQKPRLRTAESREQAYRLFLEFVDHVRGTAGVRAVTARDIPQYFAPRDAAAPVSVARKLTESIDTHEGYSAADLLLALLGLPAGYVDGPLRRTETDFQGDQIDRSAWSRAVRDAADFVRREQRLPDAVHIGSRRLSLPDFAATLASDSSQGTLPVKRGKLDLEKHVGKDAARLYNWVIHPKGFAPESLMELARLQAWTLKPARLK